MLAGFGSSDLFDVVSGGLGSIFGGGAPADLAGPAGVGILPIGHAAREAGSEIAANDNALPLAAAAGR